MYIKSMVMCLLKNFDGHAIKSTCNLAGILETSTTLLELTAGATGYLCTYN